MLRDYINELQPPAKGIAMKIRTLFREAETSNESGRTSTCVKYVNLQHEPDVQYAGECLLHSHENMYPNINNDCIFRIDKLESTRM